MSSKDSGTTRAQRRATIVKALHEEMFLLNTTVAALQEKVSFLDATVAVLHEKLGAQPTFPEPFMMTSTQLSNDLMTPPNFPISVETGYTPRIDMSLFIAPPILCFSPPADECYGQAPGIEVLDVTLVNAGVQSQEAVGDFAPSKHPRRVVLLE